MILAYVWTENSSFVESEKHVLCESTNDYIDLLNQYHEWKSDSDLRGLYYRYRVEEVDLNYVTIDSILGLTLKETVKLLDYVRTLE